MRDSWGRPLALDERWMQPGKRGALDEELLGFLLIPMLMLEGIFISEAGNLLGLEKVVEH